MSSFRLIPITLFAAALAVACGSSSSGSSDGGAGADAGGGPDARTFEPTGDHYKFVIDEVILPTGDGKAVGLDVDQAPDNMVDNGLGNIIDTMSSVFKTDLQANLTAMVDDGSTIVLADLQASSLADSENAGFWILRGSDPTPAPCDSVSDTECRKHLDGTGSFTAESSSPEDSFIGGAIAAGQFTGKELGKFSLDVPLLAGAPPIRVDAIGARAVMTVREDGLMQGRLAGALTQSEIDSHLLPQLRDFMNDQIDGDCSGTAPSCCTPDTDGDQLVTLFDTDASCDISLSELQDSSLISGLLAPDVDLLDAEGFYNPNDDGVKDSISLGVGFTAVPADFQMP